MTFDDQKKYELLKKRVDEIWAHLFPRTIAGAVMEFLVTQTGGSAGTNQSAACSFTYSIFDAINDPTKATALATAVALTGKGNGFRGLKIALSAGTRGGGYIGPDGTYVLTWVDECPAGEQDCEDS